MGKKKDIHKTAGRQMADVLLAWAEIMYNQDTKKRVLTACRDRLTYHIRAIPKSSRGKKE